MAAFDSISEIFDEIIRNSKIKGGNILRITILFLLSDYDESVKSKFCHSLMYPDCSIATQFHNLRTPRTPIKWRIHTIFSVLVVQRVNKYKLLPCASTNAIYTFDTYII